MKTNKQRILEIFITALISAGIAFLQNLLALHTQTPTLQTNVETAGSIGAIITAIKNIKYFS